MLFFGMNVYETVDAVLIMVVVVEPKKVDYFKGNSFNIRAGGRVEIAIIFKCSRIDLQTYSGFTYCKLISIEYIIIISYFLQTNSIDRD